MHVCSTYESTDIMDTLFSFPDCLYLFLNLAWGICHVVFWRWAQLGPGPLLLVPNRTRGSTLWRS